MISYRTGDDFSFDEKMANYGCSVFAFDPSMNREDHNHSARVMFYNLGLSDVNQERVENVSDKFAKSAWKTRTLATIIKELGHTEVIHITRGEGGSHMKGTGCSLEILI